MSTDLLLQREIEQVDAGDVFIQPLLVQTCERCDEEDRDPVVPATKRLWLDLRECGQSLTVGVYCDECVEIEAARLRSSLPVEK